MKIKTPKSHQTDKNKNNNKKESSLKQKLFSYRKNEKQKRNCKISYVEEFYRNMLEACFVLPTYNLLVDKQEGWPKVAENKI